SFIAVVTWRAPSTMGTGAMIISRAQAGNGSKRLAHGPPGLAQGSCGLASRGTPGTGLACQHAPDTDDEDGGDQEQAWVGQHSEPTTPFERVSELVGEKPDESIGAEKEIGRQPGALADEVVDEQAYRQPEQGEVIRGRSWCDQHDQNSQ